MHFSQAMYNALLYSSDISALDCDSSHESSHLSKNACTYNPIYDTMVDLPHTMVDLVFGYVNSWYKYPSCVGQTNWLRNNFF